MKNVKVSCSEPLCPNELKVTLKDGVEIDYCPHCKGVWLDKGELDKIIDAQEQETEKIEIFHQQEYYKQAEKYKYPKEEYKPYYKHYKKKSIWKELFD